MSVIGKLPPPPPRRSGSASPGATRPPGTRSLSMRIGTIAGIQIRVHVTFFLLVALVALAAMTEEGPGLASSLGWLVALFACVVAHELGHSLVARRNGIPTSEIELLPHRGCLEARPVPRRPSASSCASPSPGRSSASSSGLDSRSPLWQRGSRCGRRRSMAVDSLPGLPGSTCCSRPSTSCRPCRSMGVACSVRCSSSTPAASGPRASRHGSPGSSPSG